ncbi:MAG: N-6 DNA methylase [Saprospiraceae bacterium]|nr:N-6 DNA methylase [Saprospiraceae bacterium]
MLDQNTKRKIDSVRQILVGKVPDPKAQVEQITTALIYKFMDDMDKESQELGGEAKFFANGFSQYAWTKLMDQKLSGQERLDLYTQSITTLSNNKNIPQLFRDIFKGAFLPYNDPRTLSLFLKEINEFEYEHSEDLGDAFEYLLSVLGSQGDAGQFRTPRHIIDFIVAVVNPKKNEKILDPACGTAGFLISAYKHILKSNKEKPLSPDEKLKLMNNLTGYDISPDMVKLALVNMYLHGFPEPKINEYDTLSDEKRWDENADVILANPPFMTPKGGIQPHKRFSVQSNRSEVLFVDYMAEHLTLNGRAGIIVPEGIIFQSAGAYKQLRKYLIENNYLYAVVSLPAGVFNPYSGVKTSILFLDRELAKKTDKILFIKVEADGFDLGAQRREIEKNDLPEALNILQKYKLSLSISTEFIIENANVLLVEKNKIKEKDGYNLSIDRYRVNGNVKHSHFEMVKLGNEDLFKIESGGTPDTKNEAYWNGNINWATLVDLPQDNLITEITNTERKISEAGLKNSSAKLIPTNSVIVSSRATIGRIGINKFNLATNQGFKIIIIKDFGRVAPEFVALMMTKLKDQMEALASGGTFKEISKANFSSLEIPLPPIEIQQQIVSKIEKYQAIINGAKQVVENYKPEIEINEEWEMVELGSVCEINPKKSEVRDLPNDTLVSFVPMADINENEMNFIPNEVRKLSEVVGGYTYFRDNEVLVAKVTPCFENGKAGIANNLKNGIGFGSSEYYVLRCNENVLPVWLYLQITSDKFRTLGTEQMTGTGGLQRVPKDFVNKFMIPLPSISEQQDLVNQIENEKLLIESIKEIISIYDSKIKDVIESIWNK